MLVRIYIWSTSFPEAKTDQGRDSGHRVLRSPKINPNTQFSALLFAMLADIHLIHIVLYWEVADQVRFLLRSFQFCFYVIALGLEYLHLGLFN